MAGAVSVDLNCTITHRSQPLVMCVRATAEVSTCCNCDCLLECIVVIVLLKCIAVTVVLKCFCYSNCSIRVYCSDLYCVVMTVLLEDIVVTTFS